MKLEKGMQLFETLQVFVCSNEINRMWQSLKTLGTRPSSPAQIISGEVGGGNSTGDKTEASLHRGAVGQNRLSLPTKKEDTDYFKRQGKSPKEDGH